MSDIAKCTHDACTHDACPRKEQCYRYTAPAIAERDQLRAELASSASRVSELISALTLAIDLVDHWGSYASEYFQQKHDLAGDLATLRATLREGEE